MKIILKHIHQNNAFSNFNLILLFPFSDPLKLPLIILI